MSRGLPMTNAVMDRLQEARDYSLPSSYWQIDPPTWGNEDFEEQVCGRLAESYVKDGGNLDEYRDHVGNIAEMIMTKDKACYGHPWEYLLNTGLMLAAAPMTSPCW